MKEKLEKQLAALIKNKVCIAFSAGVDSTVLLYACCEAAKKEGIPLDHIAAVTFSTVLHPQQICRKQRKSQNNCISIMRCWWSMN